jgi:hypothetical protein
MSEFDLKEYLVDKVGGSLKQKKKRIEQWGTLVLMRRKIMRKI